MIKSTIIHVLVVTLTIGVVPAAAADGARNPCGAGKSGADDGKKAIRDRHITDYAALVKMGKALWNDTNLGASGMSCMTCHSGHENLNLDKVKAWPHLVKMTGDIVTLDQMITYCLINPVEAKPLDPNSVEMTAMSAYYHEYAKAFRQKRHAK